MQTRTKITGSGCCIPDNIIKNNYFLNHSFLKDDGSLMGYDNETIIRKFNAITGIQARKYASREDAASNLGFFAAQKAIADAHINPEELDQIIFAHNFGDVASGTNQVDIIPSLASRVKQQLGIENPSCIAYDLIFGCPGWIQGMIQANTFIKAGEAKKCLVIGADTLSRVSDPYDRDSMIYSDGAGACILEKGTDDNASGILSHVAQSDTKKETGYLYYGKSYNNSNDKTKYIKMIGRKIYEYAISKVPAAIKVAVDKAQIDIDEVKKIFLHQANEKMDEAIVKRFYDLYDMPVPEGVMPMNIHELGNSSVATVPTLFDMVKNNQIEGHSISKGDVVIFASVGAGMNINALVYRY